MIFLCGIWMIFPNEVDIPPETNELPEDGAEMTASAYIRELIRTGGNIDTSYPEDRARAIRVIAGIANNINQAVKLGNSQGKLYYSDIDKLQSGLDDVKKTFGEVLEIWRLQRS